MSESEARSELVLELAEEFLDRYRKGQRPPLQEYIDRHPELAAEIREVFPAMAMMENIAVADSSLEGEEAEKKVARPAELALKQLGDYRIIREIGHGGMGVVYEAEQVSLGRHVALKVLPSQALADAKQKRRFEREARAAAKLHHTNIVPVFGVGEHDGLPYYVMQFIQGLGLDVVLDELNHMQPGAAHTPTGLPTAGEIRVSRRSVAAADVARSLLTGAFQPTPASDGEAEAPEKPAVAATVDQPAVRSAAARPAPSASTSASGMSESFTVSSSSIVLPGSGATAGAKGSGKKQSYWHSVANIGRQVADALDYAHKQGILHRDVKPSNLLLDLRGTVWVTDFGLAKVAGPGGDNLTHTGDILGTLRYMPPEAFEGKSDARGDVYSLGLTMYELLAMRPAFEEKDRNKLIKHVTTGEPTPLHKVNREAPRDLVTIIHKAIDRDPGRRYATAEDMASDLQRFLDDEPILARRQTQLERYWRWARHNPGMAVLGGVLTAVLLIATLASLIVAGHMSTLADKEAKAAADERTARQEAEGAKDREAKEKRQAERAKKDADENRKRAVGALRKAEEHFARARAAVNDYLTAVSEDERLKAPSLRGLRIQLLQSALRFYQQFVRERGNDPTLRRELAGVYYKVGEIFRDLGQLKTSKAMYDQAVRLYKALASESPNDPDLQHGLAMAFYRSGALAQALPILEKLIKPEDPRYQADLGYVYNDSAIMDAKGNQAKELEFLRKALTVRERLVRLKPDDADARLGLSASLNNIAVRLKEDRNAEALALLQRAVEQGEAAYRLRPADLLTARFLWIQLNNVARIAKLVGETEVALAAHRRQVEVFDRRARDNPTVAGFDTELAGSYAKLLDELREAGRLEEATKAAEKGGVRLAETTEETTGFFGNVLSFRLAAHAVAAARARANPGAGLNTEPEAAAAVNAIRDLVLAGWRNPAFMRTDPRMGPLRRRADFKELLVRLDELSAADARARLTAASADEKLAVRRKILTTLEALAGPPPHTRFARRHLAQARQDGAQALLEAGRVEEARREFDEALLVRQQLLQETPSNEQLRADLAQSQSAAGDLFATAGKLADAVKTWDRALATLEKALRTNPNSIPYRAALAERLCHVAAQAGKLGLWDLAGKHYRRALAVETPADPITWNFAALVALETRDAPALRAVADLAARGSETTGDKAVFRLRALTTSPETAAAHVQAVRRLGEEAQTKWHRAPWARALAYLRIGQAEKALATVAGSPPADRSWPEWQILALIRHRLGHAKEATEALRQADLLAERRMKDAVGGERLQVPLVWDEWLHNHLLRAEAHRVIRGKPMPDSPYEKLFRGRVFLALEQPDRAEAEFTAAVAIRPDDADVRLTRSRVFARLGQKERMAADLLRAQQLKGDDPRTWVETGRMLAELGQHKQADVAFARASTLGKGGLNRFLDAGWWVVGPYPGNLPGPCPPESNPDPSRPVAAVGTNRVLKWLTTPTGAHSGAVSPGPADGGPDKTSFYYLAHVHADRDRTADLHFRTPEDGRLWVNGRLAFDGVAAWGIGKEHSIRVPVSLRAGRNTILVKVSGPKDRRWFECLFHDAPALRATDLADLGLWPEAADAFAEADRREPLDAWRSHLRLLCLLAAGRHDDYRRAFAEMVRRHDRSGSEDIPIELARACHLDPERTPDRDRWVKRLERHAALSPNGWEGHFLLGHAYYRAARFAEAERSLRRAAELNDIIEVGVLLAATCHRLGKTDEARTLLRKVEERYERQTQDGLRATPPRLPIWFLGQGEFVVNLREARKLVYGKDPGPDKSEPVLLARFRQWRTELGNAEDDFARLVMTSPDQSRLWIARGQRLGELKRWGEAAKAFARAAELKPKDAQVWKERGRVYADLGKWDEAATDFAKALELDPPTKPDWFAGSLKVHDQVVRLEEVFPRVAKLRPTDKQLWIQRVHYLGRTAQWSKAARASARVAELDPDDHATWHFRAGLLARAGDFEGYRKVCRELLARFGGSDSAIVVQRAATACLIAPNGTEDPSSVLVKMKRARKKSHIGAGSNLATWIDITLALGHYRQGQWDQAVKSLAPFAKVSWDHDVVAFAIRAMAQHKLNQPDAAQLTLRQARDGLARFNLPGPGELQTTWYNWHLAQLVLREAEALIPAAPVAAGPPGSTAQDYAARRDRKARADSLATQAALAQIRFDGGQQKEAEAELRAVLAEYAKIAAEEPANTDYQADLAAAQEKLGRLLVSAGRVEEAAKETQQALALLKQGAAGNPKADRLQVNLAADLFSIGDFYWKAGRPAEGKTAWQRALENLKAARGAATRDPKLAKLAADLELVAGRAYADLGLWAEASGHFRRAFAADPVAGTVSDRFHHAALLVLTGDDAEYRRYCERVRQRSESALQNLWSARMLVLAPGALPDPTTVITLAQRARNAAKDEAWSVLVLALAQLRADQVDGAFATLQEFETVSKREWQFSWPSLALMRHKAGKADEAREWLRKTEDWYAGEWSKHLAADGPGLTRGNLFFWAFFLGLRQEAVATVTGKPAPADPWLHLHRGRVYVKLGQAEQAEAEFHAAVKARPDDPRIRFSRGRIYAALGRDAEARADRARALKLAEEALRRHPDDQAATAALAGLILDNAEPKWTTLKPRAVKSEGGATLTVRPDGSVLASGANPDTDVYTVEADVEGRIGAIRLEVLPDPSMPAGGSGRAPAWGNFILTDFRVTAGESVVAWSRAYADFSQDTQFGQKKDFSVANAIDADESTGWGIWPRVAERHWAVFIPKVPITAAGKTRLTIRLAFRDKENKGYTLGRFRLSAAGEGEGVQYTEWFAAAATPRAKLGAAYLALGDAKRAVDFLTKANGGGVKPLPADYLVLALAHAKLKEIDRARNACAKAAELLKPAGAEDALRPLLREALLTVGRDSPEAQQLIAAAGGELPAALNEAIEQNLDKAKGYRDRGSWYGERGRWREAIADYTEAFRLEPDDLTGMWLGIVLVHTGDLNRFRAHGLALLERYASTEKNGEADRTLKTLILHPDVKHDAAQLARLAAVAVSGDKEADWYDWFLFAKGLHDYRTGKYEDALTTCRESRRRAPAGKGDVEALTALNLVVEAMALHGKGGAGEARRTLERAGALLRQHVPGLDASWWQDWLIAHTLFREAEGLLAGRKAEK